MIVLRHNKDIFCGIKGRCIIINIIIYLLVKILLQGNISQAHIPYWWIAYWWISWHAFSGMDHIWKIDVPRNP